MGIHKLPINPFRSNTDFCIVAIDFESLQKKMKIILDTEVISIVFAFLNSFSKQSLGYYPLKNLILFRMKI